MGAWGTGLWEDDLACDIQDEWNDLLDEGMSPRKAAKIILKSWLEELEDYDDDLERQPDESILYISLAALQMRHRSLTVGIKKKTIELIDKGADLELWEDSDIQDYDERKKFLVEFKEKLEQTRARFF
ncbi:MarR family transcriptional regulator [Bacillus sp. JJ1122]|uniref:MarR family transcriptional regulator n=1 Tax=Bacillus sp. JJ1122 TaxID=3122951 RepID=UPI002FFD995D